MYSYFRFVDNFVPKTAAVRNALHAKFRSITRGLDAGGSLYACVLVLMSPFKLPRYFKQVKMGNFLHLHGQRKLPKWMFHRSARAFFNVNSRRDRRARREQKNPPEKCSSSFTTFWVQTFASEREWIFQICSQNSSFSSVPWCPLPRVLSPPPPLSFSHMTLHTENWGRRRVWRQRTRKFRIPRAQRTFQRVWKLTKQKKIRKKGLSIWRKGATQWEKISTNGVLANLEFAKLQGPLILGIGD